MIDSDIPEISQNKINTASFLLILAMLSTNAVEMKIVQERFKDAKGNLLGDFEIVVKKLKENS